MSSFHPTTIPTSSLEKLNPATRSCIERLQKYQRSPPHHSHSTYPKHAAVLLLLYERAGKLRVLLTTRSKQLRSHPGQVALPGGKADLTDPSIVYTAFREANEEVMLPLNSPSIHTLCLLHPFPSQYRIIVTPVVAFLDDLKILDQLVAQPGEVDEIFDHPLEALLDPSLMAGEPLTPKGHENWPYETEYHDVTDTMWFRGAACPAYRMNRFRTCTTPIKGLTSDILISAAEIAFARKTSYERHSSLQMSPADAIAWMMQDQENHEREKAAAASANDKSIAVVTVVMTREEAARA